MSSKTDIDKATAAKGLAKLEQQCYIRRVTEVCAAELTGEELEQLFSLLDKIPQLRLNGHRKERLPNTLNVSFPGVSGNTLLATAPELAASTGSACHEDVESPSEVLQAMKIEREVALGAVRLSLGRDTSEEDVREAAKALVRAWNETYRVWGN
ncbi:MAG: aminotransferase class V-fold PLP-dependent enzyme [Spirochaetia bacterium]|nr:aminotransferase class V-fold PLP-dependent enzyme [Spirochaetia bacterium]